MKTTGIFIIVLALVVIATTKSHAQSGKEPSTQLAQSEPAREKIKKGELPAAAIKLLDGDAFKGWTVLQVYRIKGKDSQGKEVIEYEVEVKKDNLNQTLKFDKEGNPK